MGAVVLHGKAYKVTAKGGSVSIEYLLVSFSEERAVLADGNRVGFTNHTLMLPADEYSISLDGGGYQPATQDVVLTGTSLVRPMVITFDSVAGATAAKARTNG